MKEDDFFRSRVVRDLDAFKQKLMLLFLTVCLPIWLM